MCPSQLDDETDVTYQWQSTGWVLPANCLCQRDPERRWQAVCITITRGKPCRKLPRSSIDSRANSSLTFRSSTTPRARTDPGATAKGKDLSTLEVKRCRNTTKLGVLFDLQDRWRTAHSPGDRVPAEDPWVEKAQDYLKTM